MSKLIHSIWLLILMGILGGALPVVASTAWTAPMRFAIQYDGQIQLRITYDETSRWSFDYDSPTAPFVTENENRTTGMADAFVDFAELSAAKAGPNILGAGSTANLSKGTTLARNLREQLAIEQAAANPAAGSQLRLNMTDPRWPGSQGWVKMQQVIEPGGAPINVHYLRNTVSGLIDDFKIVLPGAR